MSISEPFAYKNLEFLDGDFPPFNPWIYGATLVTSIAIVAAALFHSGTEADPDRRIDFGTMALSATLASPIAWEHHFGIMLPVFAIMLTGAIGHPRRLAWIALSYMLFSNFFAATNLLAATPWNFTQSYLFAAALIALALLHCSRPGWQIIGVPAARPAH
jgi:hypothetical protein